MNHLRNAIRKSHRFCGGSEYVGCLIPMEVLALIEAGAKKVWRDKHSDYRWEKLIEYYESQKANGIGWPTWFYFLPPKGIHMEDKDFKHEKN